MIADPILHLFSMCSDIEFNDPINQQIVEAASFVQDWNVIPAMAEKHGMAPLLKWNLSRAGLDIPITVRRDLGALVLRHQIINQARMIALGELISAFQEANIPVMVLKGAALAHFLYPEIGLRPMKDIDLLIRQVDITEAEKIFHSLKYQSGYENPEQRNMHHLPGFTRQVDGFLLSIEVHHHLLRDAYKHSIGRMEDLRSSPMLFSISEKIEASTLSPVEMLFHLCRHAFFDNHALEPFNMIWVADILNLAEKYSNDIDWTDVQCNYPQVIHTLTSLNEVRSLSQSLIDAANIKLHKKYRKPISAYQGWPGAALSQEKEAGFANWLHATIFPSKWWLRLRYGINNQMPIWGCWFRHIFILCSEGIRRAALRIRHWITWY